MGYSLSRIRTTNADSELPECGSESSAFKRFQENIRASVAPYYIQGRFSFHGTQDGEVSATSASIALVPNSAQNDTQYEDVHPAMVSAESNTFREYCQMQYFF